MQMCNSLNILWHCPSLGLEWKLTFSRPVATAEYNLNQIPYDYIMEVTNRLKGLDLIDRIPEKLWMEVHNIVQESVVKTIPKKKGEGKTLKKQPNEVEIGNLPEKELRIMIVKLIQDLKEWKRRLRRCKKCLPKTQKN